jgi:ubiquinone/menaquinone biosynthesis C-methylase UbiE
VQAAAEALPFEDESFDAVVCVYLFHEMPEEARAEAAKEMARVLAPGGTLVLTDSMQRGDRPALDEQLVNFENLNEPHYRNYISTRLADLFVPHGLECGQKLVSSSSKTLSFTKSKGGPDTSDDP